MLAHYERAAGLERLKRLKRIVVDREGMAAELLAALAAEGRTMVTVLRTDQYNGLESFRQVGEFLALQVDRQGKVIREGRWLASVCLCRVESPASLYTRSDGEQVLSPTASLFPSALDSRISERAEAFTEHVTQEDSTSDRKTRSMSPNYSVGKTSKVTSFYSIFVLGSYLTTGLKDVSATM